MVGSSTGDQGRMVAPGRDADYGLLAQVVREDDGSRSGHRSQIGRVGNLGDGLSALALVIQTKADHLAIF